MRERTLNSKCFVSLPSDVSDVGGMGKNVWRLSSGRVNVFFKIKE